MKVWPWSELWFSSHLLSRQLLMFFHHSNAAIYTNLFHLAWYWNINTSIWIKKLLLCCILWSSLLWIFSLHRILQLKNWQKLQILIITPILAYLCWLQVQVRAEVHLTYKTLHGLAPLYLADLINHTHWYTLCSKWCWSHGHSPN